MTESNNKVLVYGAAGTQGGAVARKLIENGYSVSSIARTKEKAEQLASAGIQPVIGNLDDFDSLIKANENVDIVYLQLPVDFQLTKVRRYIQHTIEAAKSAQVKLLVVNTNVFVPEQETDAAAIEIKRELKLAASSSGLPVIFLQPTLYLENLYLPGVLQEDVLAYPVPAQSPVPWVSIEDAAQYAIYAIEHPELAGQTISIIGKESLSGEQLAEIFSQALSRNVQFHSLSISDFEAGITPFLGAETGAGLAGLYAWINANNTLLPQPESSLAATAPHLGSTLTAAWVQEAITNGILK